MHPDFDLAAYFQRGTKTCPMWLMTPSVEFSTGTTPNWQLPLSTALKIR
jgi:hypothetical protein